MANKKFERIVLYVGRLLSEEANLSYIYLLRTVQIQLAQSLTQSAPLHILQMELQTLTFGNNWMY